MKLKKTIFSLLTVAAICSVATTLVTSCSGVSKDILNNMVSLGDGSKFADSFGDSSFDLQHEINIALTDKDATSAFKTSVVNKILKGWFDSLTGISTIDNDKKQWKKDISDEWDNQIQTAKNNHLSNWKYYFQNETLNPVGGTKAKWEQNQWYSKIRDYFTTEIVKNNYLAVPQIPADKLNKDFYVKDDDGNNLVDFNYDVNTSKIVGDVKEVLGNGPLSATDQSMLNPDWWPTINFYAKANINYLPTDTKEQDKSYALIQQLAFEDYTKYTRPLSTGYVLWNYSLPAGKTDLKDIYNNSRINDSGSSTSSEKDGDSLLTTPSFAFPYFGEDSSDVGWGPEDQFRRFVTDFNSTTYNQFLDNRDSNTAGKLGLVDISKGKGYSADDASTLALINQSSNSGSDNTPYETYIAPLLDMLNQYQDSSTKYTDTMPLSIKSNDSYFSDEEDILKNFLFKDNNNSHVGDSVLKLNDSKLDVSVDTNKLSMLDLKDIYDDSVEQTNQDHIELFNSKPGSGLPTWYDDGARYIVNAMRFANTKSNDQLLPYIMIRTNKGVTFEGLDGVDYLNQAEAEPNTDSTNWRPGVPFSQERENQIIKFRTIYENQNSNPTVKGINVITSSGGAASGPLVDYLKSNLDTVILDAVNRVMTTTDKEPNTNSNGNSTSYYDDNMLGLKSTLGSTNGNEVWNHELNYLIQSFNLLDIYTTIIANYDSNNKKLFSFANTYRTNALVDISHEKGNSGTSIYKNGLATSLPLLMESGWTIDTTTDNLSTKTHYEVAVTSASNMAKEVGLVGTSDSFFGEDGPWYTDESYNALITRFNDDEKYYLNGVIENYKLWNDSLQGTNQQAIQNGKGNTKAYQYNYSENILTYNDYVNDMLWKFGGSNTFSNSVKTAALRAYMGEWWPTDDEKSAITSMYITNKLITSDTPITSYFNNNSSSQALAFDNYQKGLWSQWESSLDSNLGSSRIMSKDGVVSNGYTDKVIDWDTYLATMYRLSNNDYSGLVKWLQNKIGSDYTNTTYIAWAAKDNTKYHESFYQPGSNDEEAIYGWKNNYDGLFDSIYQNTNNKSITTTDDGKTYTSFDSHWQFAPMPTTSNGLINAMGFLGLQTKNSNTLDKVSANAKADLFDNFYANGQPDSGQPQGSLYQFNNGADTTARKNLYDTIDKDTQTPTMDIINRYANFIQSQTGVFGSVIGAINNAGSPSNAKTELLKGIGTSEGDKGDSPLDDSCFKGFNKTNTDSPTLEIAHLGGNQFIPDDDKSPTVGSRVRVMQINSYDVSTDGGKTSADVVDNLKTKLGDDMISYLLAQAALDTSNQTATINDVIKTVFNNHKLVVYDRRFNDQLGSQWVKDWKTKN